MALTPEEVINKRFQATKFKEGYNPEEVDDFLDEIVIELRRLNAENSSLKRQLEEAESRAAEAVVQADESVTVVEGDVAEAPTTAIVVPEGGSAPSDTAAPVAGNANDPSTAASLLAMAQRVHDDYVLEGQREKARLIAQSREEADTIVAAAEDERVKVLGDLDSTRTDLEGTIEQLRGFEQQYRTGIQKYIEEQLSDLKSGSYVIDKMPNMPAKPNTGSKSTQQ